MNRQFWGGRGDSVEVAENGPGKIIPRRETARSSRLDVEKSECSGNPGLPLPTTLGTMIADSLGSRKRNDIRQHTIRVRVRQTVSRILVDQQPAASDEFVSWAAGQFQ